MTRNCSAIGVPYGAATGDVAVSGEDTVAVKRAIGVIVASAGEATVRAPTRATGTAAAVRARTQVRERVGRAWLAVMVPPSTGSGAAGPTGPKALAQAG